MANERYIEALNVGGGYGSTGATLAADGDIQADGDLTVDGTIFGGADGYTGATAAMTSGTYTPALTGVANVASATANASHWSRVGNVVTVGGYMLITPTAGSTLTKVGISLPIASSVVYNAQIAGAGGDRFAPSGGAVVYNDSINDRAELSFTSVGTGGQNIQYIFSYLIA